MINKQDLFDDLLLEVARVYGIVDLSKSDQAKYARNFLRQLVLESAAEDAKKKGLTHLGHGIYGKNNKPMYKSVDDKLVPVKHSEKTQPKKSTDGAKEQPKRINIFDEPKYQFKPAELEKMKSLPGIIASKAPKMRFENDAEKKEVTKFLDGLKTGDIENVNPAIINKYIRVGENEKDPKLYLAAVNPNDFSQKTRQKVEGIGSAIRTALIKAGIKPSASITTSTGEASKVGRSLSVQGLFPSKEDPKQPRTIHVKLQKGEGFVKIGAHQINHIKEPSLQVLKEMMREVYAKKGVENPTKEAKFAQKAIQKNNQMLSHFASILGDESTPMIDVLPGVTPDSSDGRKKLIEATSVTLSKKIQSLIPNSKSPHLASVVKILHTLPKLEGEQFEAGIKDLMTSMSQDEDLKKGLADTAETFTYMRKLNAGQIAYLPMAKNFKLGDVIAFSQLKISPASSPEDIVNSIQNIYTSIDVRSVKFKAGGAAAAPAKIELSIFKHNDTRTNLNKLLKSYDLIWSTKGAQNLPEAEKTVVELARKSGLDPNIMVKDPVIMTVYKRIMAAVPKKDARVLLKQLQLYYISGKTLEQTYNADVDYQLFSNERYSINKSGTTIDTTNGVSKLAKIRFKFDVFGMDRPNATYPTEFHHSEVNFEEPTGVNKGAV